MLMVKYKVSSQNLFILGEIKFRVQLIPKINLLVVLRIPVITLILLVKHQRFQCTHDFCHPKFWLKRI